MGDKQRAEQLLFHLRSRHGLIRRGGGLSLEGGNAVFGIGIGASGLTTMHEELHRRGYLDGTVDHDLRNLRLAL